MEGIEALRNYFEAQSEAAEPDVIEPGDYVRVGEDVDIDDDQDLIYMQDIQAVHRVVTADDTIVMIETLRGRYAMMTFQVYLVDVTALHGEMEEMITEEAAQVDSISQRNKLAREYEDYRENARFVKVQAVGFTDWLEVNLIEARQAIVKIAEERKALQAQVEELEKKLRLDWLPIPTEQCLNVVREVTPGLDDVTALVVAFEGVLIQHNEVLAQIKEMAAVMRDTAAWMKTMGIRSLLPEGGSKLYYALNKALPDE